MGPTAPLAEIPSFYSSDIRCYLVAQSDSQKIRFNESAVPLETSPDELLSEWQCSCFEYQAYRFGPGDSYAFTGGSLSPNDGESSPCSTPRETLLRPHLKRCIKAGWVPPFLRRPCKLLSPVSVTERNQSRSCPCAGP